MEYLAKERFVLAFIKEVRLKDPGIGGSKLWHMYRKSFGNMYAVGRDRFEAIVSKFGLNVRKNKRSVRTTDSGHNLPKYSDLTQSLLPNRPNQLWVSDITYIPIGDSQGASKFCFLSLLTDAYSKEIIGYCVGESLESIYTLKALDMGLKRLEECKTVDLIHHSDRGVQYACFDYVNRLKSFGIRVSMTESGNPKDNAIAERVNGIIKNEFLKEVKCGSVDEVDRAVSLAVDFYNNERPHMSLNMMTPAEAAQCSGIMIKKWTSYKEKYLMVV